MVRRSVLGILVALNCTAAAQDHEHGAAGERLGTVHLQTSCDPAAQPVFDRAVALLHSFDFSRAIDGFNATLKVDASCAMADWGLALSRWGNPFAAGLKSAAQLQQGRDAIGRAAAAAVPTDRERQYVDAAAQLYAGYERVPQDVRVRAYRDAMTALAARYPDDDEAVIFHALSLAFAADPADKTYTTQLEGGALLEALFAKHPDHPGLAHYIIHTYDVPALADRALEAARRYATIAPSAPHALHMPSHTFTRVGYWQESIDTNIASAASAKRGGTTAEELHATDYQAYAYLQTGQDGAARRLVAALPEIARRFDPSAIGGAAPPSAGFFALAAIPARYALERGAWADAVTLVPKATPFPYTDAMTHFARAIGAAHLRQPAPIRESIDALDKIRDQLTKAGEAYWAEQVEIQRLSSAAWLTLVEGRNDEAIAAMRAAALREDATEKNATTPGPLAPARELLGEMLLEARDPAAALREFEATLKKEPNRFRAIAGAAKAASTAGDRATARKYYQMLLKVCARADRPGRAELVEARKS
jgi:tetratricopeptide (TPR) repeat protein